MTRILQIHARYRGKGGEDVAVDSERDLFESAGHEVIRFERQNSKSNTGAFSQLIRYAANPALARELGELVSQVQPAIAHIHNTWFAISPDALLVLKRAGVPTVHTIHNYRLMCANAQLLRDGQPCEKCVGNSPWAAVRYRCYRESRGASALAAIGIQAHRSRQTWHRGIDQFVALTEFSRGRLVSGGLPSDRLTVQPNFVPDPGRRAVPVGHSLLVLCIGRLSKEKGLSVALKAWAQARPAGMELVIAGVGPEREKLDRLADSSVRFVGQLSRSELSKLLLRSRAVLVPSIWYESQPLTVLEAMAAGTPVLASAIGGLGETVSPLGSAWQVEPGSVTEWTRAIKNLADDELVNRGGLTARKLYEDRYSPHIALEEREQLYSRLLHRSAAA